MGVMILNLAKKRQVEETSKRTVGMVRLRIIKIRRVFGLVAMIGLFVVLGGCALLWEPLNPGAVEPAPVVEPVETPFAFDPLEEPDPEVQCAYVWASRHLPEFTELLQAAYRTAQMDDVAADVSGYGENCLDPVTKQIVRYAIMRSDFYLNVTVGDIENRDALGQKLSTVMAVLQGFPAETFPGNQPSSILVRFESGEDSIILSFTMTAYEQALEDGLRGAALFEALDNPT
jgi:hypothetical protein